MLACDPGEEVLDISPHSSTDSNALMACLSDADPEAQLDWLPQAVGANLHGSDTAYKIPSKYPNRTAVLSGADVRRQWLAADDAGRNRCLRQKQCQQPTLTGECF